MNKERFWEIIDAARNAADGWHGIYAPLVDQLAGLGVLEILSWRNVLDKYRILARRGKLRAACAAMTGSDDRFDHFVGWLIAQGKSVYLSALRDPDSLMDAEAVKRLAREIRQNPRPPRKGYRDAPYFEKLLYAADRACEERTYGKGIDPGLCAAVLLSDAENSDIEAEIRCAPDLDGDEYSEPLSTPERIDRRSI